jgi:hypothetical protein
LAKDILFLFIRAETQVKAGAPKIIISHHHALESWLTSYFSSSPSSYSTSTTHNSNPASNNPTQTYGYNSILRARGPVHCAIHLDLAAAQNYRKLLLRIEGKQGRLPNLDFINTISKSYSYSSIASDEFLTFPFHNQHQHQNLTSISDFPTRAAKWTASVCHVINAFLDSMISLVYQAIPQTRIYLQPWFPNYGEKQNISPLAKGLWQFSWNLAWGIPTGIHAEYLK